jgi:hypothetical protein
MSACGMHLPNRDFTGDDWIRIRALNVRHYLDLNHFRGRWATIKADQPDALIHARIDARGALGNPEQEAADLARLVQEHVRDVATWRVRNEPQLESPGVTPREWEVWLTAFGQAIKRLAPGAVVFAPAVSPGTPDWIEWLDATARGARDGGYDGMDVHAYGNPGEVRSVVQAHRDRWSGRLLVTEHNFGAGREYDQARYAADLAGVLAGCATCDVEAVCIFIWEWETPDMALPTTVNVKGLPIERAIQMLPREDTSNQPGDKTILTGDRNHPTARLDKEKLKTFHEWAAARLANDEDPRVVPAFVEHLRRIGADFRRPHEYGLPIERK